MARGATGADRRGGGGEERRCLSQRRHSERPTAVAHTQRSGGGAAAERSREGHRAVQSVRGQSQSDTPRGRRRGGTDGRGVHRVWQVGQPSFSLSRCSLTLALGAHADPLTRRLLIVVTALQHGHRRRTAGPRHEVDAAFWRCGCRPHSESIVTRLTAGHPPNHAPWCVRPTVPRVCLSFV